MSFRFHPEAEDEFLAAIYWYEARSAGLGGDFAAEILEEADLIVGGFSSAKKLMTP